MEKESSQTAASQHKPKQERRWIRKEAKGSQCAGKQSNIKCAVSEENACVGFTKNAMWQTRKKASLKKAARVSGEKDEC